ncbi:type II toxin-antitoxin system RelE/ParE family toxin [Desulfotomaculum copahuensis]|uniref:Plasmid stabilization protein n=1 Tax=Desulfotomaculum copahuensis TaxID=1838280 RepID=A0A1B7LD89_9FIRM|nr:type II toxin-antitoxin system RelE/ParE family toxin [Desulfotomaculum copahuensis]OAT81060.1 plasmid stabilization protein [Desulfotomaculum copahuensis]
MYKLVVTELAHQDLDGIVSYIAIQLANPTAASDFLDEVDKCYGYLKSNPMMYSKCSDGRLEKEGYRKAVIKNYILVYKVYESDKIVIVLRFFYGARDYAKLI